jgi:hypothetical protein
MIVEEIWLRRSFWDLVIAETIRRATMGLRSHVDAFLYIRACFTS